MVGRKAGGMVRTPVFVVLGVAMPVMVRTPVFVMVGVGVLVVVGRACIWWWGRVCMWR